MRGRLTPVVPRSHARRRAGSLLLVGASAAALVAAQAATAVAAPATTSAASQVQQPLSAAQAAQLSQNVSQHVIVLFKNQPRAAHEGTSAFQARAGKIARYHQPLLGEFRQVHAAHVHSYTLVNAVAATVSAGEEARLKANPAVQAVIPDGPVYGPSPAAPGAPASPASTIRTLPGACLPNGRVQLEPEALQVTNTDSSVPGAKTARSLGFTGAGVKVAWMADGIDPVNANFLRTPGKARTSVFTDYKDFSGDGTTAPTTGGEAFLDANAIAGQGKVVYNAQHFSAESPAGPCNIRIEGTAPGASLVGLKVFGQNDASTTSGFLDAISYSVNVAHVNLLNESFGANPIPDLTDADAIKQFNEFAVASGVTVTVSSGDAGPFDTIGSPATDPAVIDVGASTDFRWLGMTNYALADDFARTGWLNDNISSLSSGGFTQTGATVNLVAPGDSSFASCTPNVARFSECTNFLGKPSPIERSGGTSQSAPLTAGVAALVIQAYAKTHGGALPSPALVKQILLSTATDLGAPADEQGAGLLNAFKAVQLAESINGGRPAGSTLATSTSQLNAVGNPGTPESFKVSVTNEGTTAQAVRLSGRRLGPAHVVATGSVTLSNAHSPHVTDWLGLPDNFGVLHFNVPLHQNRLSAEIAYPGNPANGLNARVRLILIDPMGRFAAHSLPQGVGNFGNVDVVNPVPGRWTAVIFSIESGKDGGTAGRVPFAASVQQFASFGSVSPTSPLSLAPGATGSFMFSAATPASPGDASGSVVLRAGGSATSIPVTLRSLVNVAAGGAFRGILTGGNGRPTLAANGQVQYYQFNVPAFRSSLSASVTLANDPADQVNAYLINPQGQTEAYGSNNLAVPAGIGIGFKPGLAMSLSTLNPLPGPWTLIVDFNAPVVGNELADPFSGHIRFGSGVSVNGGGLPDSAGTKLARGSTHSFNVKIHNATGTPEDFFLDPRLAATGTVPLAALAPNPLTLPLTPVSTPQLWVIPTESSSVTLSASGATSPVTFDGGSPLGDPDLFSGLPTGGSNNPAPVLFNGFGSQVTSGLWIAVPALATVTGFTSPAPSGATVSLNATAQTREFDTSMTSPVGDFWLVSVNPATPFGLFRINPGQTRTISVTIKVPAAATAGAVVSGDVFVDTIVPFVQDAGSETAAIPYAYTVS